MSYQGDHLLTHSTLHAATMAALGRAKRSGRPCHVIRHRQGDGGTLIVSCDELEGSGLPVVSRVTLQRKTP